MNFGFTEEQDLLRAEVRKFLDEKSPLERVREVVEEEGGMGIDDGIAILTTVVLIAAILLVDYWQTLFADGGTFFTGG